MTASVTTRHVLQAPHSQPTFANIANQIILQSLTSSSTSYIRVRIEPLSQTDSEKADAERVNGIVLVYFLILGFSIVPAVFVYSVVTEVTFSCYLSADDCAVEDDQSKALTAHLWRKSICLLDRHVYMGPL